MNRALILMYHLVDTPRSTMEQRFCSTPADFAQQMEWLAASEYTVVSLSTLCDCMDGKSSTPANPVAITFDDGFSCVLEHAAPTLRRLGFPATMFALSDRLAATNDWMSCRGFPERRLLSSAGLNELRDAGFTIGSHTRTHARLTELTESEVQDQIVNSKVRLEDTLGHAVEYFAYPYGAFSQTARDIASCAGYRAACSTRAGFNRPGEDMFLLRRIDISGHDRLWQFRQKLTFGTNDASFTYPLRYAARRIYNRLIR